MIQVPSRRVLTAAMSAVLLVAGLVVAPATVQADAAPVAHWPLDEGSNVSANDVVGAADGTLVSGPSWLSSGAAVGAAALRFDGTDDRVEIPSTAALEQNRLLITAWVRAPANAAPTPGQVIVEKGAFGCDGASYGLYTAANGIRFSVRAYDGTYATAVITEDFIRAPLWDGNWHLVAGRILWLPGETGGSIYGQVSVDGSPELDPDFIVSAPSIKDGGIKYSGATGSGMRIGGPVDATCATDYFHGDIDDVRLFNDDNVWIAGLMPPIYTTTTVEGPATGHPQEYLIYDVNVSPPPRWSNVFPQLFYDGNWHDAGLPVVPDANGNAQLQMLTPGTQGTYPFRAYTTAAGPYWQSEDGFDLVISSYPTTTSLVITPSPTSPFQDQTLTATVSSGTIPSSLYPLGSVEFYDVTGATPVLLGTSSLVSFSSGVSKAVLHTSVFDIGTRKVRAKYIGPDPIRAGSQSTDTTLQVNKATTSIDIGLGSAPPVETNHSFVLQSNIFAPNDQWATSATVTFRRVGVSTPLCTVAANPAGATTCTVPAQPAGAWQFTATYSGNTRNLGATSTTLNLTVVADTVHATGVGTQYTTFYPVTDTYRDTVGIKGTRDEPISVTAKIYSPAGTLLKTVSFASATGAYNYNWNGRNSSGTIYSEGKYKVVQTLKDAAGITKTVTSYVTLSKKKLITYTKTITKLGSSVAAKGSANGGTVTLNTTSGYAKLYAPTAFTSWAGAGWEITIPSATIYKWMYVKVYGRHSGIVGETRVGAQNFSTCAYVAAATWYDSCFASWGTINSTSGTTLYYYRTPGLTSSYRSGTKVRVLVTSTGGTTYIYKAQVVVQYQVLGY